MKGQPPAGLRPPTLPSDRYDLLEPIGSGAMGSVYRAWDRETLRHVAIKTLLRPDPDDLFRLKREFRSLARIAHPNLVRLYELVAEGDRCFFAMELIEGRTLLEHLRERSQGALRDAFQQLAAALQTLHAAAKVHRDVKPNNVMVDASGRVVLLDFGLVGGLGSRVSRESQLGSFVGTLAYMAPEQAHGRTLSPAADWYSFGVMLYEALVHRSPFESASPMDLVDRGRLRIPAPATLDPDCPGDLSALAMSLLAAAPEDRPGYAEIVAVLQSAESPAAARGTAAPAAHRSPFVGREAERRALRDALETMKRGEAVAMTVDGESGIGKTTLVERFLAELDDDTLVLRGRCHPYEVVPFQAADEAIDELSRYLAAQPEERRRALLPRDTAALRTVFPVLARIALPQRRAPTPLPTDPREVRRQAFLELRELMGRVADRQPMIVWIDDLQWGDADCEPLLRELIRPPGAPPILWLFTFRNERDASPLLATFDALLGSLSGGARRAVSLGPLDESASRELAALLASEAGQPLGALHALDAVARESSGSPFLVGELVRHSEPPVSGAGADFGAVLSARIGRLSAAAQRLVQTVAVAAGPLERRVAIAASGAEGFDPDLLAHLERERLLRTTTAEGRVALEVYHDRIRERLEAQLPPETRRQRHRAIARTLQRLGSADAHALHTHFSAAGDAAAAAEYAMKAGEQAAAQLAFDQAALFYRRALDLRAASIDRCELLTRLAEALANAGRGGESAAAFEQAAEAAGDAPDGRSVALKREAAEQHLLSGRLEDGRRILEPLLASLGVGWPATTQAAVRDTLFRLAALGVPYLRFRPRADSEIPGDARLTIDVCQAAAKGLLVVDPIGAAWFSVRALQTALRFGDLRRTGRALGAVGVALVPVGGPLTLWARDMLRRSVSIGEQTGDPYLQAVSRICEAEGCFVQGRWSRMLQLCDEGTTLLRASCRGVRWEIDVGNMAALRALEELGRIPELNARLDPLLHEAEELDDRYARVTFRFYQAYWSIAGGEIAAARGAAREALANWGATGALHLQHLYALRIEAFCDLSEGRPEEAWGRVRTTWPEIRRANLLRHPLLRTDAHLLRACTALALAEARSADRTMLQEAEASARVIARAGRPDARAAAALIRSGVANLHGDRGRADALLDEATRRYDQAGMELHAAYARRRRGQVTGGDAGADAVAAADREIRARGVADPERWLGLLAPGFGAASG